MTVWNGFLYCSREDQGVSFLQLANDLHYADLLQELHARLAKIQSMAQSTMMREASSESWPGPEVGHNALIEH